MLDAQSLHSNGRRQELTRRTSYNGVRHGTRPGGLTRGTLAEVQGRFRYLVGSGRYCGLGGSRLAPSSTGIGMVGL